MKHPIPSGLQIHCSKCDLVIPADAPTPDIADCEFVSKHKLAWFNPNETIKGQHTQAVATWALIHDQAIKNEHPESMGYLHQYQKAHKEHFNSSAARNNMTPEDVQSLKKHPRDGWVFI